MSGIDGVLVYFVDGTPVPQGSKKAWISPKTGHVVMREDQGVRHSTWRHQVTGYSRQAMADKGLDSPLRGEVSIALTFHFHRPQFHYGTGKNAEKVKKSAPVHPIKPPDIDKLARSILDSLTSVVFVDDAQVFSLSCRKVYVDRWQPEGVLIRVL